MATKSKMVVRWVIIAGLFAGCSPASMRNGLHYAAAVTEWTAQGSMACDAGSTHNAMGNSKYFETNPVMGDHPSNTTQAAYWGSWSVGIAAYNRVLPDILRIAANTVLIAVEVDAVASNTSLGVPTCGI